MEWQNPWEVLVEQHFPRRFARRDASGADDGNYRMTFFSRIAAMAGPS